MRAFRSFSAMLVAIGLLLAMTASSTLAAGGRTFNIEMSGAQEPGGGDDDATGTATVTINAGLGTLCYSISWQGIGGESAADDAVWGGHIHNAPAGTNGGIFVHLFGAPMEARTNFPGTFSVSECMSVPRSQLVAILADSDGYYLNLHNDEFPGGAIRGQLR